ncbi:indolepyruvate ferredoxin oxidoreductase [Campylobacter jejuni]|nr:indolepyruvate ferredoxin oxidoreductase [Campylobacter jejuni]
MNKILTANDAVARGAFESGVKVATGYPGTPSTSIIDDIMRDYKDIYCEWSVNEKVALEVAMGASFSGARSLAVMKTVGLNVAHDALISAAQSQINGGLVIVVADDVGRITDDYNDCRYYGRSAGVPILEPSDSLDALKLTKLAFKLSELYSLPVIIRLTTVTCKTSSLVNIDENYQYSASKNLKFKSSCYSVLTTTTIMGMKNSDNPKVTRFNNDFVHSMDRLTDNLSNNSNINPIELKDKKIGFITSGASYLYLKETLPDASILKLGAIHPLPIGLIKKISTYVDKLYVIEDGQSVIEKEIRSMGINIAKDVDLKKFPDFTFFTPEIIKSKFLVNDIVAQPLQDIPFRLPMNCAGCSHLFVYYILKKYHLKATTDVTCGGLGIFPHINAFTNAKHMGSSIGIAHGFNCANDDKENYIAVIGDGGFWATGINGLINLTFNKGNTKVIIVDNQCIAMTGGQDVPSSRPEYSSSLDIKETCHALGIQDVIEVDPYKIDDFEKDVISSLNRDGNGVIIVKKECLVKFKPEVKGQCTIDNEACLKCKACLQISCPALEILKDNGEEKIHIDSGLCVGCKLCQTNCKNGAINYETIQ